MLFDLIAAIKEDKQKMPGMVSILLLVLAMTLIVVPTSYKISVSIELLQGISLCIVLLVWGIARAQRVCLQNALFVHRYITEYYRPQNNKNDEFFAGLSLLDEEEYPVDEVLALYDSSFAVDYSAYRKGEGFFKRITEPCKIPVDGRKWPAWMRKNKGLSQGQSYPFLPE